MNDRELDRAAIIAAGALSGGVARTPEKAVEIGSKCALLLSKQQADEADALIKEGVEQYVRGR